MSRKKLQYQKKTFESTGANNDTSANIYMSMLLSNAWQQLSKNAQLLYVYCKSQYYAEKQKPVPKLLEFDGIQRQTLFTFNKSKWQKLYKLYSPNGQFYKDMQQLIEYGFIRCIECGNITRTKSIYQYSDVWRKYGTSEFNIPNRDLTSGMKKSIFG